MMSAPLFGVDYYPEHWERARWSIDARLMQQAGITTVRLAEFAWSRLEPREGYFDFAWLDEAIEGTHGPRHPDHPGNADSRPSGLVDLSTP